ncbi:HK97-gp10 family putative phage morphogenesis protein [Furfurilactobacillus sp. WILCCON 0119]|uniref:HK97-gp10 family putative phage morphogenesis protein n=1 Tax=Furfurilactobacillus entadae TaxID=2922307 RepID=UPI0035E7EF5A
MSLSDDLEGFISQAEKLIPDTATKSKMTGAGAKVFESDLRNATKGKHYTNHKDVKEPHLADAVMSQNTDMDGEKNGSSVVGFGRKAYIARFLNDGTKSIHGDHFVDNARRESEQAIFEAQKQVYDDEIGGDK